MGSEQFYLLWIKWLVDGNLSLLKHEMERWGLTLYKGSSIVRKVPGKVDGVGGDLADPDGGGHRWPHHLHTVADAVLAMTILHSAHNTG